MALLPKINVNQRDLHNDPTKATCGPSGVGIVACLTMLADEANLLRLPHTVDALTFTIKTCESEIAGRTSTQPSHCVM